MKITLYKAAEDFRHLLDDMDPETGELPDGYTAVRDLVAHKAQSVAAFILENNAQADMVEAHAKALMDRVKSARKRSDWLKGYLQKHMAECGIKSITADDGTFCAKLEVGRDESVEIYDPASIPEDYMREIPAKSEPDKVLIKKAIKDKFTVPGARLVAKDRLTLK